MIINTYRWVKERCRSWSAAHEDSQKMGWLEIGTKLHCVEQSGDWYRFDVPVMPLITTDYPKTWVFGDYLEAEPPVPEPQPEPVPGPGPGAETVITAAEALAFVRVLKHIFG